MHSRVIVILPPGTEPDDVNAAAEAQLEPYDENGSFTPRRDVCGCVLSTQIDWLRDEETRAAALDPVLDLSALREAHVARPGENEEDAHARWLTSIAPLLAYRRLLAAQVPLLPATCPPEPDVAWDEVPQEGSQDPRWNRCGGTGLRWTTGAPETLYDWYEIGGRWGGELGELAHNAVKGGRTGAAPAPHLEVVATLAAANSQETDLDGHITPDAVRRWVLGDALPEAEAVVRADGTLVRRKRYLAGRGLARRELGSAAWDALLRRELAACHPEDWLVMVDVHS